MDNLDSAVLTILGSAVIVVLGYVLNGWRERDFERRKTNYHSKLSAFNEINEAVWGLGSAYVYLRIMLSSIQDSSDDDDSIGEILTLTAMARDLEVPLGSKTSQSLIDRWNSIGTLSKDEDRQEALTKWILGARMSLTMLYLRILTHHLGRLAKAGSDALLVADTSLVQEAINKLVEYLVSKLNEIPLTLLAETHSPIDLEMLELKKIQNELDPLLANLQLAMHHELSQTMRARERALMSREADSESAQVTPDDQA